MAPISTIFVPLLFHLFVLTAAAKPLSHMDQILDPDELLSMALPPPPDSALPNWTDWDTWEAPQDIKKNFTYYRCGYDEDGSVVYTSNFGNFKYRELVQSSPEKVEEFWKYHEQLIRRLEMDAVRGNKNGIVIILDFDGFSLKNFASDKANYAAESFVTLAKPFIGPFIEKFEIYGTRSEKWKPRLLCQIPASQLPPELGGSEDWKPLPEQVTKS